MWKNNEILAKIKKNDKAKITLVLVALFIFYLASITPTTNSHLYFFHSQNFTSDEFYKFDNLSQTDSIIYILLAKGIITEKAYVNISHPNNTEHKNYPFFFPLMLIPIILTFGINFFVMKLLISILAILGLYFAYILIKEYMGEKKALLITFLSGFSTLFFIYSINILSEIPYLLFSMLGLIFTYKYSEEKSHLNKNLLLVSLFVLLGFFTRYIGLALVIASILFLFFKNNDFKLNIKKAVSVLILTAVPILLWVWRNSSVPDSPVGHTPSFANVFERPVEAVFETINYGIVMYSDFITRVIFPGNNFLARDLGGNEFFLLRTILIALVALIFLYSFLKKFLERRSPVEWYVAVYFLVLLTYPFAFDRLVVPIIPFIIYYFVTGLYELLERLKSKKALLLFGTIIILSLSSNLYYNSIIHSYNSCYDCEDSYIYTQNNYLQEKYEFIKNNTAENSIIVTDNPWIVYLNTGRKAIIFPFEIDFNSTLVDDMNYFYVWPNFGYKLDAEKLLELQESCNNCYFSITFHQFTYN